MCADAMFFGYVPIVHYVCHLACCRVMCALCACAVCGYVPVVMLRVRLCALFAFVCALPVHRLVIVNVYGRWAETYVDLVEVFLPVMFCGVTLCSL